VDQNQRQEIARAMTERADELNNRFNQILQELGFDQCEIVEFRVAPREDRSKVSAVLEMAEPCPTICVVTPGGGISCFPQC
jgi:hypothetical protein